MIKNAPMSTYALYWRPIAQLEVTLEEIRAVNE